MADYSQIVAQEALAAGVDPTLAQQVMSVESAGNPSAVSPKGAIGLMQLMPATARDLGVDPRDPIQNIRGGVRYLKQLMDRYHGDQRLALAAYNAGPAAVDKAGGVPPFPETQRYVAKLAGDAPQYLDKDGNPITTAPDALDANGHPIAVFKQSNGFDANGNPIVDSTPLATLRDIAQANGGDMMAAADALRQREAQEKTDALIGAGKSIAGAIHGAGQIVRNIPGVGAVLDALPSVNTGTALLQPPANEAQKEGKAAADFAMFFMPGSALNKAKAAIATGSGVLDALVGAGLEGASAAGVNAAQRGTVQGAGNTAALTAGTALGAAGVFRGAQAVSNVLGQRIERALLKPTAATLEGQSERELVKKVYQYNVGGTLGQSYDKVQARIQGIYGQLRHVLQVSGANGSGVSLNQIAKDVEQSYVNNQQAKAAVSRILDNVEFALNREGTPVTTGILDPLNANIAKQAVGDMGAWLHDLRGNIVSDADRVTEDVANRFYTKLKTAIEQNTSGPVAALNKQLSDLIPIRLAIIKRIPVEDRANILNIGDMFGLSGHTLGLSLANRVLRSGHAANALVNVSGVNTVPLTNAITRAVAGGDSSEAGQ